MRKNLYFPLITIMLFTMSVSNGGMLAAQLDQEVCGPNDPVFSINLLSPNTNPQRNQWAALMESEFPKACIGIDTHLSTDWTTIAARTWAYGGGLDYVPPFEENGFDVLFVGYSNPGAPVVTLDDLYATYGYPSDGGFNFIHYSNATFDELHRQYSSTLDPDARDPLAYQMQEILYQDQPTLTLLYGANVWLFVDALSQSLGEDQLFGFSTASFSDAWKDVGAGSGLTDMVYAHSFSVNEFVPQVANSYISNQYMNAIWQGAYARDLNTRNYIPVLADSLPVYSEDNTRAHVSFAFGPDLTFADGHQVDMEDVEESFKRIFDQNYQDISYATYVNYFGNPNDPSADNYRPLDQMYTVIDSNTIEFNLTEPYFLATGLFGFPILPTHTWGTTDSPAVADYDYNSYVRENPTSGIGMGTGPFRYASIGVSVSNLELQANPNYWNGSTALDRVSFKQYGSKISALSDFDAGSVHMIDAQMKVSLGEIESLSQPNDYDIINDFSWQEISINQLHPIIGTGAQTPLGLEDPSRATEAARYVRQAMSHAIPRNAIIEVIVGGLASPGITAWAEGTQHFNPNLEPYEYDLQRAKQLLAMAGYDTGVEENPTDPNDSDTTYYPTNDQNDNSSDNDTGPELSLGPSFSTVVIVTILPIIMINSIRRKSISK